MLFKLFVFFVIFSIFTCASIFLWVKWQKVGPTSIMLLVIALFIFSFGIGKFLIIESKKFDAFNLNKNTSELVLQANSEFISPGKAILNKFKIWNKILRGKAPIYTTDGGSQIKVDSISDEKSIKIIKRF